MWRWVLVGCVLPAAACAGQPSADVSAIVYQTRSDTPLRRIEIQVRNDGAEPVTVQRAELRSQRLAGTAVWDQPLRIPAGAAVDLKVQLPEPTCAGGEDQIALTVDGERVVIPAADPMGQLDEYIDQRCFEQAVDRTAELRIDEVSRDGIVVFTRPGDATIGELGDTILFAPVDPQAIVAAPGDRARTRNVVLRANRCDAHALGEDKQGTYFGVEVTLPDGRTGEYTMGVDQRMRGQLHDLYARLCELS